MKNTKKQTERSKKRRKSREVGDDLRGEVFTALRSLKNLCHYQFQPAKLDLHERQNSPHLTLLNRKMILLANRRPGVRKAKIQRSQLQRLKRNLKQKIQHLKMSRKRMKKWWWM